MTQINTISDGRRWENVSEVDPIDSGKRSTLMHVTFWNVLADACVDGFDGANSDMTWQRRWPALLRVMNGHERPDIIGLAECQHYKKYWRNSFAHREYSSFYAKKSFDHPHGVVLAFDRTRYKPIGMTCVYGIVAAVVALLRDTHGGKIICVAVTHLKAKVAGAQKRVEQIDHIIACAGSMFELASHTIFMGDLNTHSPNEEVLQRIESWKSLTRVTLPWTTWKMREGEETCLEEDYIYVSSSDTIERALAPPSNRLVRKNGLLPGLEYPSDHLMLAIELRLNAQ